MAVSPSAWIIHLTSPNSYCTIKYPDVFVSGSHPIPSYPISVLIGIFNNISANEYPKGQSVYPFGLQGVQREKFYFPFEWALCNYQSFGFSFIIHPSWCSSIYNIRYRVDIRGWSEQCWDRQRPDIIQSSQVTSPSVVIADNILATTTQGQMNSLWGQHGIIINLT